MAMHRTVMEQSAFRFAKKPVSTESAVPLTNVNAVLAMEDRLVILLATMANGVLVVSKIAPAKMAPNVIPFLENVLALLAFTFPFLLSSFYVLWRAEETCSSTASGVCCCVRERNGEAALFCLSSSTVMILLVAAVPFI
ncbi:unnamed protein product [Cyprideis torosa]|uniref:Uncharacterized protein n=1 Tax=Cyprideis torosa TaxID=163714 RepID=A0A7R8WAP3_9CRUS|nr:unnamed protein product [Cyprideis torosa]CAG0886076.1 unnamed protein product [Cyprideis torosa]